jgi:scyllo-inositol 2-dehydrogenase (NADP+)
LPWSGSEPPLRVAALGLGWVTTHRHIPWLLRHPGIRLTGVVDHRAERVEPVARRLGVGRSAVADGPGAVPWLDEVDAVTIGTPPATHAGLAASFLGAGKHVLLEKPFAMSSGEADDLAAAARRSGCVLAVVHNFQFARSVRRLRRLLDDGSLGEVRSIRATQLSNPARRLPVWYEELPLGLFTDESPHLLYLVRSLAPSEPVLEHVRIVPSREGRATPHQVDLAMRAGELPIGITMDFESPVSEWHLAVLGTRAVAMADVFRDVLVVVGNDGLHLGRDILGTSWSALRTHLAGVAASGALLVRGRLSYGNDEVIRRFVAACRGEAPLADIGPDDGRWVTAVQDLVVGAAGRPDEDPAREQLLPS